MQIIYITIMMSIGEINNRKNDYDIIVQFLKMLIIIAQ